MMMATTSKMWINPPIVVLVTRPRAQRMSSMIAIVINMGQFLSLVCGLVKLAG